jgi:hypothetical protein
MDDIARRWTTRVLDTVPLDASQHARVLALRGSLIATADPEAGRADMLAALPQLGLDADGEALVSTHAGLALELTTSGLHHEAARHAAQGVEAARRWNSSRLAVALAVQAAVCVETDPELAEQVAGEAFDLLLTTDVGDDLSGVAANVAWTLFATGRPHDGLAVLDRAISVLPPDAVPTFVTIHLGWARLLTGDPSGALACFTTALEGEVECETRWHADVFTGAGCALAELGHPDAVTLLEGASALVDRSGHTLAGWQIALFNHARSSSPPKGDSWAFTREGSGAMLAGIIREATTA